MCMRMGWTSGECLRMPARRFFVMLKQSRKAEVERRANFMIDLCQVSAVPSCSTEYQQELIGYYQTRIHGGNYRRGHTVKMDYKDPRTALTLKSICDQKARLEGL